MVSEGIKSEIPQLTVFDKCNKMTPTGMKAMPMMKKVGKTVPAVRTGCHDGNLKREQRKSINVKNKSMSSLKKKITFVA